MATNQISTEWRQLLDTSSSIAFSETEATDDFKAKFLEKLGNPKEDQAPRGRSSHSLNAAHLSDGSDILIAFGGEDIPRNAFENAIWINRLDGSQWIRLETKGNAPHSRLAHAAVVIGDHLWVIGGRDNEKEDLDQVFSLHLLNHTWTLHETKGDVPKGRSYHAITTNGNSIYTFSGCTVENGKFKRLNDLYHLDTATLTWEKLPFDPENAPRPRGGSNVVFINNKLYVFGGFAGKELGDLWAYDLEAKKWQEITNAQGSTPAGRSVACALPLSDNRLLVFGGEREESPTGHEGAGKYFNDTFVYDTIKNTWLEVVSSKKPAARGWFAASSLADQNRVFVFGGYTGDARINDLFELKL